ncbi:hypothetical protein FGO68_gene844 [Halteria grandinella]|uniref:Uncharacterized protein n=1 Tax=Halteria grandinella TaxID=5974 RepID=A0A8J8T1V6_HALGN|nr:hypothetical protein FGO68_gene844 [Halteria grandinella]
MDSKLLTGSTYSIMQKIQNETKGKTTTFDHPFIQSFLCCIGEMMAFIVLAVKNRVEKKKNVQKDTVLLHNGKDQIQSFDESATMQTEQQVEIKKYLFAIPAWLDMTESVLKNIATTMIAASIVQMLRGSVFIYCALLGLFFLKKPLYRHHFFAMMPILGGLVLVGIAFYLKSDQSKTYSFSDMLLGFILLQIGQIFGAFAFVAEEKFLGEYEDLDPLVVVGWEGVWGFLLWLILLPIFQNIPCDNKLICTNGVIEDTVGAIDDYAANPTLIILSIALILDVSLLNIAGVNVTKYGSSAQRTTCDLLRNMFVWVFFLFVPIYNAQTDSYQYIEMFSMFQFFGFIVLTFGVLVYNEIVVLPCWSLNQYTRIAIGEREKMKESQRTISVISDDDSRGQSDDSGFYNKQRAFGNSTKDKDVLY